MWLVWQRRGMVIGFWWANLREGGGCKLGVDWRITLKCASTKQGRRAWSGLVSFL
jgi:hypothetical protein